MKEKYQWNINIYFQYWRLSTKPSWWASHISAALLASEFIFETEPELLICPGLAQILLLLQPPRVMEVKCWNFKLCFGIYSQKYTEVKSHTPFFWRMIPAIMHVFNFIAKKKLFCKVQYLKKFEFWLTRY